MVERDGAPSSGASTIWHISSATLSASLTRAIAITRERYKTETKLAPAFHATGRGLWFIRTVMPVVGNYDGWKYEPRRHVHLSMSGGISFATPPKRS